MTDEQVTQALALVDKGTAEQAAITSPFSVFQIQPNTDEAASKPLTWSPEAREELRPQGYHGQSEVDSLIQSNASVPVAKYRPLFPRDEFHWRSLSPSSGLDMLSDEGSSAASTERDIIYEIEDQPEQTTESSIPTPDADLLDKHLLHNSRDISSSWSIRNPSDLAHSRDQRVQETESSMSSSNNGLALQVPNLLKAGVPLNALCQSLGSPQITNSSAAMLIHHYTNRIVHLMQPVSHKENPFQTLYLPLAIEGSTATGSGQNSQGISPATVAVFHSLMCSAATNLQGLGSGESGLQQLACRHKERALSALRNSLERKVGRYKDLMVAILSLVSADVSFPCRLSETFRLIIPNF